MQVNGPFGAEHYADAVFGSIWRLGWFVQLAHISLVGLFNLHVNSRNIRKKEVHFFFWMIPFKKQKFHHLNH